MAGGRRLVLLAGCGVLLVCILTWWSLLTTVHWTLRAPATLSRSQATQLKMQEVEVGRKQGDRVGDRVWDNQAANRVRIPPAGSPHKDSPFDLGLYAGGGSPASDTKHIDPVHDIHGPLFAGRAANLFPLKRLEPRNDLLHQLLDPFTGNFEPENQPRLQPLHRHRGHDRQEMMKRMRELDRSGQVTANHSLAYILQKVGVKGDLESLLYGVDLEPIFKRAISGSPLSPLTAYKNPCWTETLPGPVKGMFHFKRCPFCVHTGQRTLRVLEQVYQRRVLSGDIHRVRCLPYVYLAGVTKSGTTDLTRFLLRHPNMQRAGSKEPMWWSQYRIRSSKRHPFTDYLVMFEEAAYNIEQHVERVGGRDWHPDITMDSSTFLLWREDDWGRVPGNAGLQEPAYTAARSLRLLQPLARLVVSLRHPADRVYSHYAMMALRTSAINATHFDELVQVEVDRMNRCIAAHGLRACAYKPDTSAGKDTVCLRASLYAVFLEEWLAVFPPQQILVVRAEDYFSNRTTVLNRTFSFLGLEAVRDVTQTYAHTPEELRPTLRRRDRTPMMAATRDTLNAFFKPYNARLARLLKDDRYLWAAL